MKARNCAAEIHSKWIVSLKLFDDEPLKTVVKSLRVQIELLAFFAETEQRLLRLIANLDGSVDGADEHQMVQILAAVQQSHRHAGRLSKLSAVVL